MNNDEKTDDEKIQTDGPLHIRRDHLVSSNTWYCSALQQSNIL